jgi:hypothetical protein
MKNKLAIIKDRLLMYPWFRERKNKNVGIAKLLVAQFHLEIDPVIIEKLIVESYSLDRAWRKTLEENPNLRGTDYEDKVILEQETQIALGYEPKLNI